MKSGLCPEQNFHFNSGKNNLNITGRGKKEENSQTCFKSPFAPNKLFPEGKNTLLNNLNY